MRRVTAALTTAAILLVAPLLSGCTSTDESAPHEPLWVVGFPEGEGWAKAGEQGGMTGVFGTIENHGDADVTITEIETDAAEKVELHETVDGTMREMQDDFVIPAGGTREFAPGADHIMLLGLTEDLKPGDELDLAILYSDGSAEVSTVFVKDYAGAQEDYDPDDTHEH